MQYTYQLTNLPGLASVLSRELTDRLGKAAVVRDVVRVRNADISLVEYNGAAANLRGIRTAEDVFVSLDRIKLSGQLADMKAVANAGLWSGPLRQALTIWSQVTGKPLTKRLTWRVVVQADDAQWRQYRRQELMLAAERALLNAGTSWRLNRDEAPLELWLQQVGRQLLVSLRLTTSADRQHGGRTVERAAALRPSVGAAMVYLSKPADTDVVLDPMCGTGTLLLERAVTGRYQQLLGGDNDPAAAKATLANFGPRHQPREITQWDARKLPLDNESVTTILCNLPWGRQIGEKATMPALYDKLLPEFSRVLAPGGRMILLTSEWNILKHALKDVAELNIDETISNVEVLGRRADIFVITKNK